MMPKRIYESYPLSAAGFHLYELCVVLSIFALLATFTMPTYQRHIAHMRRLEAITILARLAIAMEKYHCIHHTYAQASLKQLGFTSLISQASYHLQIASATMTDFLITATPTPSQRHYDPHCPILRLTSQDELAIHSSGPLEECGEMT